MALRTLSAFAGALGRRVSLSLVTVSAFVAVNLLLIAACLFALRQNMNLRADTASAVALLTLANGTMVPPLVKEWYRVRTILSNFFGSREQKSELGYRVTGSDLKFSAITERLSATAIATRVEYFDAMSAPVALIEMTHPGPRSGSRECLGVLSSAGATTRSPSEPGNRVDGCGRHRPAPADALSSLRWKEAE